MTHLLGTAVNTAAVIAGGLLGRYILKGIPYRYEEIMMKGMGLAVILIGIQGAMSYQRIMVVILSMVAGGILGEWIDIDRRMNLLGAWAETRLGASEGSFAKGFTTGSLLFCTGSMAIVGAMNSGLQGNNDMLFAKSLIDLMLAIIFSSALGIGVAFAAVSVFIYEGILALGAGFVKDYLTPEIITEISATGNLVLVAVGWNFIVPEQQKIRAANMIPAIFLPWLFIQAADLIKGLI